MMEVEPNHDHEEEQSLAVIEWVTVVQTAGLLASIGLSSLIMGSKVDADDFTRCVKKPQALWLTMLVVVFLAPVTAYVLVLALQLHFTDGITVLITSCCPAGSLAPVFAYHTQADPSLCLSVFVLSTAMSVGWIPLGIFFCSSAYSELNLTVIPHNIIVIILAISTACLAFGMLFRKYKPKWADRFVMVFSFVPVLDVVTVLVIVGIILPHSFHMSSIEVITVTLFLGIVFVGTYVIGLLTGLDHFICRSMALSAGNKNVLIALTIIHSTFDGLVLVETLPIPTLFLMEYIIIGSALSMISKIYRYFRGDDTNALMIHGASAMI